MWSMVELLRMPGRGNFRSDSEGDYSQKCTFCTHYTYANYCTLAGAHCVFVRKLAQVWTAASSLLAVLHWNNKARAHLLTFKAKASLDPLTFSFDDLTCTLTRIPLAAKRIELSLGETFLQDFLVQFPVNVTEVCNVIELDVTRVFIHFLTGWP